METVLGADVLLNPRGGCGRLGFEKQNTAVILNFKIRRWGTTGLLVGVFHGSCLSGPVSPFAGAVVLTVLVSLGSVLVALVRGAYILLLFDLYQFNLLFVYGENQRT